MTDLSKLLSAEQAMTWVALRDWIAVANPASWAMLGRADPVAAHEAQQAFQAALRAGYVRPLDSDRSRYRASAVEQSFPSRETAAEPPEADDDGRTSLFAMSIRMGDRASVTRRAISDYEVGLQELVPFVRDGRLQLFGWPPGAYYPDEPTPIPPMKAKAMLTDAANFEVRFHEGSPTFSPRSLVIPDLRARLSPIERHHGPAYGAIYSLPVENGDRGNPGRDPALLYGGVHARVDEFIAIDRPDTRPMTRASGAAGRPTSMSLVHAHLNALLALPTGPRFASIKDGAEHLSRWLQGAHPEETQLSPKAIQNNGEAASLLRRLKS